MGRNVIKQWQESSLQIFPAKPSQLTVFTALFIVKRLWVWLSEWCFPNRREALASISGIVYTCNPSTCGGGSGVQLHSELEARLICGKQDPSSKKYNKMLD